MIEARGGAEFEPLLVRSWPGETMGLLNQQPATPAESLVSLKQHQSDRKKRRGATHRLRSGLELGKLVLDFLQLLWDVVSPFRWSDGVQSTEQVIEATNKTHEAENAKR